MWRNVSTNIAAIIVYVQTMYPGLDAERIIQAFKDGTIVPAIINLALMYFLYTGHKNPSDKGELK
jgi:hypothetical protein